MTQVSNSAPAPLDQLVKQWRKRAASMPFGAAETLTECADELEAARGGVRSPEPLRQAAQMVLDWDDLRAEEYRKKYGHDNDRREVVDRLRAALGAAQAERPNHCPTCGAFPYEETV